MTAKPHQILSCGEVLWDLFPDGPRFGGAPANFACHAALLTTFFPKMGTAFAPGYVFLFFCFMMVLQLVWVKIMVPETKGRSLEEIQRDLGINLERP